MARKTEAGGETGGPARIKRIGAWILAAVLLFSVTPPGRILWERAYAWAGFGEAPSESFSVHFLDVGKADAIVICCDGRLALLDAGTPLHGETVVDYLARNRLGAELDLVIASHPDSDHVGGIPQVLEELPCGCFLRGTALDESYGQIDAILAEKGILQRKLSPGDRITLGRATLEVLGPVRNYEDPNNCSLGIRLTYRDLSILFCGDMEKEAEEDLLDAGTDLSARVLKVAHHGSNTSTTRAFLQAVSPEIAIISTGRDRNDLPSQMVTDRLDRVCREVYRTDVDGTVVLTYGDGGLKITTEKGTGP